MVCFYNAFFELYSLNLLKIYVIICSISFYFSIILCYFIYFGNTLIFFEILIDSLLTSTYLLLIIIIGLVFLIGL